MRPNWNPWLATIGLVLFAAIGTATLFLPGPQPGDPQELAPRPTPTSPDPGLATPPKGPTPILLGIPAFTDEYALDNHLRLEIPLTTGQGKIAALVVNRAPNSEGVEGLGSLQFWELKPLEVEPFLNTRVNTIWDCVSPALRFQSPLVGYEYWRDTTCQTDYLLAKFPFPEDDQVGEPALWVAMIRPIPLSFEGLDHSLAITQPAAPPEDFVGVYERVQQMILGAMPETMNHTEAQIDVRFGQILNPGETGILAVGSWPRDPMTQERMLLMMDGTGTPRLRLTGRPLEAYAAQQLSIEFLTDLTRDGLEEAVVRAVGLSGESRAMLWSFKDQAFSEIGRGGWWGCSAGVPTPVESPVYGGEET